MNTRILKIIPSLLGLLLFSVALWVLHSELNTYHLRDIVLYSRRIPFESLIQALLLTIVSYGIMTGYDFLALRFVNRPLSIRKTATASFIGYAFSNNIGFSMLAGASVRFRLYSSWGLSALEITKIVFFCTISLWLGFLTLGSAVFLLAPMNLPQVLHFPFASDFPLGVLFLLPVVLYATLLLMWKGSVDIRGIEYSVPPFRFFMPQVLIATLDWALAGGVLYLLLPSSVPFPTFIGMYLIAQLAGLISQIPGGLGVFEAVMLVFLTRFFPASIIGSLVVYRIIFYFTPLALASALLAVEEVLQRRHLLRLGTKAVSGWLNSVVPPILTVITFISGVILLFSGATPANTVRLEWMRDLLPLPAIELSHFLGSIVGVALLILARGIQRRIDTAYYLSIILLAAGSLLSLLKGLDYEEAAILLMVMLIVLPSKQSFYRKGRLSDGRFTPAWLISIALVLVSTAWLTYFANKHVEYSSDLWWRFAFMNDSPRSLRAIVGATVAALVYGLDRLFHPSVPRPPAGNPEDLERAVPIIRSSPETLPNLALLGDKALLFNEKRNAFIMYGISGQSWIAMGDPVGPKEEWPELTWRFSEMSDQYGGMPAFYEVSSENLHVYIDLGMTIVKLGEEAKVNLADFSLSGRHHKDLRHAFNKLSAEGYTFELVSQSEVSSLMSRLRKVSDAWLADKRTAEKGFSLGFFREEYISRFPVAVVRKENEIVAFGNVWTSAGNTELSVDLMRYLPDSSSGIMDYLFLNLMQWGKDNGFSWFNLGMAPLSGLEGTAMSPLWNKIGAFIFSHAENFYNFKGLRAYKDKFSPVWKPRYLALTATLSLPMVLTNTAALIAGGVKGIVMKQEKHRTP